MTQLAFELEHVSRRFRRRTAIDGINCSQEAGRILGLAGLPGSGKTTLVHLISGLDKPTRGQVHVLGGNPLASRIRARIGYAPDPQVLDPFMTARQTMVSFCRLKGFSRQVSQRISEQLLEELHLTAEAVSPVTELSVSSRQLLCIGISLLGDPDLLLFDGNLDTLEEADTPLFQSILRQRAAQGCTIVLASQCLARLGDTCDTIALLHQGSLLGKATPEEIRTSVRGLLFKYVVQDSQPVSLDLEGVEARFTGSSTEILADRDIADQLGQQFGSEPVSEGEPSFEEACLWILRNPGAIATRSKMWGTESFVVPGSPTD